MGVFEFIVGFLLSFAWYIVQAICGLTVVFIVYFVLWFVLSMIWEIAHEPSYKWFVRKVKELPRKLSKSKNKEDI